MEWSKLKNIIILLLVMTNVCLLGFVGQRVWRGNQLEQQARADAIAFLAQRGVQIQQQQIPAAMTLTPQKVERDLPGELALAAALLGTDVQAQDRGGGVYRYFNARGSVQFHSDGAFLATLEPKDFPLGKDPQQDCLALLSRLHFDGELLEQTANAMTFRQCWQGSPVFNRQVTVTWTQEGISSLDGGRRLVGQPTRDDSRASVTTATALIAFFNGLGELGDVCSRIDAIAQGYLSATSLSGPMTLTPVWRVTTDTGTYQLDTVTGAVSRVS
jgi:regulatory protein YycI of two-component signal transduction system YycFG